jgi:hypothetical protein
MATVYGIRDLRNHTSKVVAEITRGPSPPGRRPVARHSRVLRCAVEPSSAAIGVGDRWIAATAASRRLTLVTEDGDLAEALGGCDFGDWGVVEVIHAVAG